MHKKVKGSRKKQAFKNDEKMNEEYSFLSEQKR